MSSPYPMWTDVVTAIATPAIAVFAALLAFFQWWTSHQKLKLDLFEKRYAVYAAAMDLMSTVFRNGYASDEQIFDFVANTSDSKFLLDMNISDHLSKMPDEALRLNALREETEPLPVGPERSANVQKERQIKDWIRGQREPITEEFSKFLKIRAPLW